MKKAFVFSVCAAALALVCLGGVAQAAGGAVIHVNCNAPAGGNGQSWATAYNNLQLGLGAAQSGDQIWVAAGTYKPTTGVDRRLSLVLKDGVALYGGFPSIGNPGMEDRDWVANETILSGDIGAPDDSSGNSYHVVTGADNATLDGFVVTSGNANGPAAPEQKGGGMYNVSASPSVINCTFTSNSASNGGGMYNESGSPTVTNCTFTGNYGNDSGGGMYNQSGSPTVTNCTFTSNTAWDGGGMYNNNSSSPTVTNCAFASNSANYYGGGMYNSSSSLTVTNCTFTSDSAGYSGGGMYNSSSSPTVTNCTFTSNSAYNGGGMENYDSSNPTVTNCTFNGNSAPWGGGGMDNVSSSPTVTNCAFTSNSTSSYGGGMYNYWSSSPTVTNCTFTGNSTDDSGGGIYNSGGSPTVNGCAFSRNDAYYYGGGMENVSSSPTVTNCTFNGNSASGGGGMDNSSSSPTVTNCTFVGNGAYNGGGMYNYLGGKPTIINSTFVANWVEEFSGGGMYDYQCTPTVANCVLFGNIAPIDTQISQPAVVTYSDVQGGFAGEWNIDTDPLFARYPSPGGDAVWGTEDDDYGDLRLGSGALCIDAGSNAAVPAVVITDLAGNLRVFDGNADGLAVVDMGAFEYGSIPPPQPSPPLTVSGAKLLGNGESVQIGGAIVSAGNDNGWDNFLYIESEDRSSGIRVEKTGHGLQAGAKVDVEGTMRTNDNGERYIEATSLTQTDTGSVGPLVMSNKSLGGGDWHYDAGSGAGQKGVKSGVGLNNIGLFVGLTGRVTYQDTDVLYVDDGSALNDGSGHAGVKMVVQEAPPDLVGKYVVLVGISSCFRTGDDLHPAMLVTNGSLIDE